MKRTLIVSAFAALALAFSGGSALAQNKGKGQSAKDYQKVKSYDFTGDTIDGELVKPDGEFVDARKFAEHTSLIKVRQDFIKEILKSAEDL